MFQVKFDGEQGGDEKQEHDQHAITSFVDFIVQGRVFPVHENRGDDETHQKNTGKDELSSWKHCA